MKSNEERLQEILARLDTLSYVKPERIPNIDLYMDQVTTFMDEHLVKTKRYPDDKVLTKTMINNYAKNNLLPPPNKKKYSRQHILLLISITLKICSLSTISRNCSALSPKYILMKGRIYPCRISMRRYSPWRRSRWSG